MDNSEIKITGVDSHVDGIQLVLFADGELSIEEATQVKRHLDTCMVCQAELEEIKIGVAVYEDFHQHAYSERFSPPTGAWQGFEEKLASSITEETATNRAKILSTPQDNHQKAQLVLGLNNPALSHSAKFTFNQFLSFGVVGLAAVLVIGFFFLRSNPGGRISVTEVISHAKAAQASNVQAIQHPVVYQKVRIERRAVNNTPSESIVLESWNDMENSRLRESSGRWSQVSTKKDAPDAVGDDTSLHPSHNEVSAKDRTKLPPLMREMKAIYRQNNLGEGSPISLNAFSRWSTSLPQKRETVQELQLDGRTKAYRIKAETENATSDNALRALEIIVRADDWHPVRENFVVADKGGDQTYEVAELDYKLVPLSELPGNAWDASSGAVFDTPPPPEVTLPKSKQELGNELLIDILSRLDQVDALTQDQLVVERKGDILKIHGMVPNDARKATILSALSPLENLSNLDIDIASATTANALQSTSFSKPLEAQSVNVPLSDTEGNPNLRHFLMTKKHLAGPALEQEMQRFTSVAIDHSSQAHLHALALEQIIDVIPESDSDVLSAEAFEQWRSLALKHLHKVQEEVTSLHNQLSPISSTSPDSVPLSAMVKISGDLDSQVKHLSELTNTNDKILWEILSAPSVNAPDLTLSNTTFLRSLGAEEGLIASIEHTLNHSSMQR